MTTLLTLHGVKGSELTFAEGDANLTALRATADSALQQNGSVALAADLPMGGFTGTNARDAVADNELATRGQKYIATGATASRKLSDRFADMVSPLDAGPISSNNSAIMQTEISFCLSSSLAKNLNLFNIQYNIISSLKIDRGVNTTVSEFHIKDGGIGAAANIPLIDTNIAYTTSPTSEWATYDNVNFNSNGFASATVMTQGMFRQKFNNAYFYNIKYINATIYTQTHYLNSVQARAWTGSFFKTTGNSFDLKVANSQFEAGGVAFDLGFLTGCAFVGNLAESLGSFIVSAGGNGVLVAGTYCENNSNYDVIYTDTVGFGAARGVAHVGNLHNNSLAAGAVRAGDIVGAGVGNYFNNNGYDVAKTKFGYFKSLGDYAVGSLFSLMDFGSTYFGEVVAAGVGKQQTGITAHAGGTQAAATVLTTPHSNITTVATANDSVCLQPTDTTNATYARVMTVTNSGVANLAVYYHPNDVSNFGGGFRLFAFTVAPGQTRTFTNHIAGSTWVMSTPIMLPTQAAAVAAVAAPTQAEFNALVTNYNTLLANLKSVGLML